MNVHLRAPSSMRISSQTCPISLIGDQMAATDGYDAPNNALRDANARKVLAMNCIHKQ